MTEIRDILRDLGIPFHEHDQDSLVTPGWVGIVCPLPGCGQGNKHGRGIHVKTLKSTCWKCGSARIGDVLAAASGRPLRYVLALLGDMAPRIAQDEKTPPKGKYTPPAGVEPLNATARAYLAKRGLDPDQCAEMYSFGWIGPSLRLSYRVFMPVFIPRQEKPVSWTTRAVGRTEPRYLSAPPEQEGIPIKHTLFGEHLVRNAVAVTEGPLDAVRIGPGAVATYGLTITKQQISRIAKYPVRIIILDAEPVAQRRADKLASDLSLFPGSTSVVQLQTGKDPGDASESEIHEIRSMLT